MSRLTVEQRSLILAMHADGKTPHQIARRLGGNFTRSAVAGHLHRMHRLAKRKPTITLAKRA